MPLLTPLFAAIGPFLLWPVEYLLPFPFIIEELFKAVLVYIILGSKDKKTQLKLAIASGSLFAISEAVFYFFNILIVADLLTLATRLLLTIPLHITTILVILFFGRKGKVYFGAGIVLTAAIHYFFNLLVG